jgi:hypothetical protein
MSKEQRSAERFFATQLANIALLKGAVRTLYCYLSLVLWVWCSMG